MQPPTKSFAVKDCALMALATGQRAHDLREMRYALQTIHPESIYYHFWGGLMRPRFDDPEYGNDFAAWANHGLHDGPLAERLAAIDPTRFGDIEALRQELIEVIDTRLDEEERPVSTQASLRFNFIRSRIVVFDTRRVIPAPQALPEALPALPVSSIFYHFVDARRRTPSGEDDFRKWLGGLGPSFDGLRELLAGVDYYFVGLNQLRSRLALLFRDYFEREHQR